MKKPELLDAMARLGACGEATDWVRSQEGSAYALWRRCDRPDWLIWLAARVGVSSRRLVGAVIDCAEAVLVHVPHEEDRPRLAVDTARAANAAIAPDTSRAYSARAASAASAAAYAACAASAASAAAYAASAAADAADAAAADAAHAAARAADAAARAADAAADPAAVARIVRRWIPWALVRDGLR